MSFDDRTLPSVLATLQHQRMAVMTTLDGARMVSRPMMSHGPDEDGHLWFVARRDSEKVAQLRSNNHISLSFADGAYVSVMGTAEVLEDPRKLRELWDPQVRRWVQGDKHDPVVCLIRVTPSAMGYWDSPTELRTVYLLAKGFFRNIEPMPPRLRLISA